MSGKDGGCAFPWRQEDGQGGFVDHSGMSLRDYFAAAALIGMIGPGLAIAREDLASGAFVYADAMLKARNK